MGDWDEAGEGLELGGRVCVNNQLRCWMEINTSAQVRSIDGSTLIGMHVQKLGKIQTGLNRVISLLLFNFHQNIILYLRSPGRSALGASVVSSP